MSEWWNGFEVVLTLCLQPCHGMLFMQAWMHWPNKHCLTMLSCLSTGKCAGCPSHSLVLAWACTVSVLTLTIYSKCPMPWVQCYSLLKHTQSWYFTISIDPPAVLWLYHNVVVSKECLRILCYVESSHYSLVFIKRWLHYRGSLQCFSAMLVLFGTWEADCHERFYCMYLFCIP